jgi:tetratricopeptide (TPR) repeat protein
VLCGALVMAGCSGDDGDGGGGTPAASNAEEQLNEALTLHVEGDLDGAVDAYLAVLELDPQNKFAFYNLGLIDQTRGEVASAENRYRLTLNVDPEYQPALFNLAILRTAMGDHLEAIDLYRRLVAIDDGNASAHFNLGLALHTIGQTADGDAEIARAVELNPELVLTPTAAAGDTVAEDAAEPTPAQ